MHVLTNHRIIQVVSQLRPESCGVSDHAVSLAHALESEFGIHTAFIVLNSTGSCDLEFPRIYCAPSQLLEACSSLSDGEPATLLLHYSGYGFSADGAPVFLPRALERVRKEGRFRVAVYFHELFARSMPWRSAFWYSRRQRRVVREIFEQCDFMATNLAHHFDWIMCNDIRRVRPQLHLMPVFSNIGESVVLEPISARMPVMIVFGLPGTRQRSYARLSSLTNMLNALGIKGIVDIGPAAESPSKLNDIPVTQRGILSATELADLLSKSMFGFVPHPAFCLAKSGVFAALCANGTIPILGESFSGEVDGLTDGVHLVSPRTAAAAVSGNLEHCSAACWRWYMRHRLYAHAETYYKFLAQAPMQVPIGHSIVTSLVNEVN